MFGIVFGNCCVISAACLRRLVLLLFWGAGSAVAILQLSISQHAGGIRQEERRVTFITHLALVVVSGGCSLGFIGSALPLVCSALPDVPESWSGGLVELHGFAFGALLTQVSTGIQFVICAAAAIIAAILMTVC